MLNPQTLPYPQQISYDRNVISTPYGRNTHKIGSTKRTLPVKSSSTLKIESYDELNPPLVQIGDTDMDVPPQDFNSRFKEVKVEFYGTYSQVSSRLILQSQSNVLENLSFAMGKTLRKAEDLLTRNMLMSTASAVNCVYGHNGDTPREVIDADLSDAYTSLLGANAYNMFEGLEGENKFGTAPQQNAYLALAHTKIASTLDRISTEFTKTINYPSQTNVTPAEYGSASGFRFFLSTNGMIEPSASVLGNDIIPIVLEGWDSVSVVEQDEFSASFLYRPPEMVSTLGLFAEVGFIFAEKAFIQRDDCVIKLNSTTYKGA